MDEKLARGLARDLFRRLAKRSSRETDPATPAIAKLLQIYLVDGGVNESQLVNLGSTLASTLASVEDILVDWQHIKHPIKSKVVVKTTSAACVGGEEQSWMIVRSDSRVLQRNVLKVVETVHHVAIAQHAVFRLFQRSDMHHSFTNELLDRATLWTPTLLFTLFGLGAKAPVDDGTGIAIPFWDGLLLGTIETNHLDGPEQGPTITDFRRGGHRLRRLKAPFQIGDDRIPTIGINTYVSRHELFDNQQTIFGALEKFEEYYRKPMERMRQMCALGYPDTEVTKLLGPVQFNGIDANALIELADQVRAFFETPEWRQHTEAHRPRFRQFH